MIILCKKNNTQTKNKSLSTENPLTKNAFKVTFFLTIKLKDIYILPHCFLALEECCEEFDL